ncbi:response regulator transcription factor [Streptomyces sp. NPDC008001]|uniref:response regulator transcription factor n=1 Tax=Streptomyces sp. NPDC008001 TaxID=3364804 RepID=UPI0036EC18BA
MAAQLRTRDYGQMLDLVVAVLENEDADAAWHVMARQLLDSLGCDSATFSHVQVTEGTGRVVGWAPEPLSRIVDGLVQRRIQQRHPLLEYGLTETEPVNVADICDGWRNTSWYREARRDFGVTQQVGVPLLHQDGKMCVALLGRRGDFASHDLAFLRRLQPVIQTMGSHLAEMKRLRSVGTPTAGADLTPREATVLGLLAEGLTAAAIARRLAISPHTVNRHLERIYRKLGTNNRVSTLMVARQEGLVA